MTDVTPPASAPVPPAPAAAPASDGKTLGIVALIVSFFFSLIGIILGFVARSQSKKAGVKNTPATVAIILGFVFLVLGIILAIVLPTLIVGGAYATLCEGMDPGVYQTTDGTSITCP